MIMPLVSFIASGIFLLSELVKNLWKLTSSAFGWVNGTNRSSLGQELFKIHSLFIVYLKYFAIINALML